MVPPSIRKLWSLQKSRGLDEMYDIQDIGGIGPMIALTTWPEVLRGSLWMHFIGNNGALASLINGGSSVLSTDTVVGMTWHVISKLDVIPWFDRVDTKSNPVDGLSRGDARGPWVQTELSFPGASLSDELRRAKRFSPS